MKGECFTMKKISTKVMTGVMSLALLATMTTGVFAAPLTGANLAGTEGVLDTSAGTLDGSKYNEIENTNGQGGDASSVVILDADATTFKVTVPIALHVSQDTDGQKTYADAMTAENATGAAKIINECPLGQVQIKKVEIVPHSDYEIKGWSEDYANMKVNSKVFGFKINGAEAQAGGSVGATSTVVNDNSGVSDTITTTVKNGKDGKTDLTRVYADYNITPSGDSAFPIITNGSVLPIDYEAKLPAYSQAVDNVNVGGVVFTVDFN